MTTTAGIQRHADDQYEEALAEYEKKDKPKGHRIFLCYNRRDKQFWVNVLFTKDFLEFKNVTIIK
jgi:hypothetical protein